MTKISPQQLADLWYLKFGHEWVARNHISQDWKDVSRTLMQSNLVDYDLVYTGEAVGLNEIIKLKETCK